MAHAAIDMTETVMACLAAGESKDTTATLAFWVTEMKLSKVARMQLFRSWGSSIGLLPIGGPAVWGNHTWAPEDTPDMLGNGLSFG